MYYQIKLWVSFILLSGSHAAVIKMKYNLSSLLQPQKIFSNAKQRTKRPSCNLNNKARSFSKLKCFCLFKIVFFSDFSSWQYIILG